MPLDFTAHRQLGVPYVWLDNDANMGAYGEYALGAARGARSAYAIFAGTGLGAGYILDGVRCVHVFDSQSQMGRQYQRERERERE